MSFYKKDTKQKKGLCRPFSQKEKFERTLDHEIAIHDGNLIERTNVSLCKSALFFSFSRENREIILIIQ